MVKGLPNVPTYFLNTNEIFQIVCMYIWYTFMHNTHWIINYYQLSFPPKFINTINLNIDISKSKKKKNETLLISLIEIFCPEQKVKAI